MRRHRRAPSRRLGPVYRRGLSSTPGAQTAQTLAIVSLVLSFVCGLGLFCVPVAITLATRADRRIKASSGALVGADQVRTARIVGWIAAVISGLWCVAFLVAALTDSSTTA